MNDNCNPAQPLSSNVVSPNEGATDADAYIAAPSGELAALMLFVTFPDVSDPGNPSRAASQLLGQNVTGPVAEVPWFSDESSCLAGMLVELTDGYRQMPRNASEYDLVNDQKQYVQDAVDLFAEWFQEAWTLVYVVATPNAQGMGYVGPAFAWRAGDGVVPSSCPTCPEVRFGVTFVPINYNTGLVNLIHETGHTFGLPDLYCAAQNDQPTGQCQEEGIQAEQAAGAWDLMCNMFEANHWLAYHRFKIGWIDTFGICSLNSGSTVQTLSPQWSVAQVNAVMVPVSASQCYFVEVPDVTGTGREPGVLVYFVDADIVSGRGPIIVQTDGTRDNTLVDATYGVGETFTATGIRVEVQSQDGDSYTVQVTAGAS